jgi:TonB family protein
LARAGIFSLLFHMVLLIFLAFSLKSATMSELSVYQVRIRPYAPLGAVRSANPGGSPGQASASLPAEKVKPGKGPKGTEILEKAKSDRKVEKPEKAEGLQLTKKQKPSERSKGEEIHGMKVPDKKGEKLEKLEKERTGGESLQQALDEIRKKAALDAIQQRVARRNVTPSQGTSSGNISPSGTGGSGTGSGSGTGTGSGTGSGSGTGGYPMAGVPWGSSQGSSTGNFSKLDDYYSMIWAKVKQEWTLPENLPKEKMNIEAVIVVVVERDGKIQKSWFEKKSGNPLYDQMAMRAIKKADPFPPIPAEFSDQTFEIGIRFHPE